MRFVNPWMLVLVLLVPVAGAFWTFLRARSEARLRAAGIHNPIPNNDSFADCLQRCRAVVLDALRT